MCTKSHFVIEKCKNMQYVCVYCVLCKYVWTVYIMFVSMTVQYACESIWKCGLCTLTHSTVCTLITWYRYGSQMVHVLWLVTLLVHIQLMVKIGIYHIITLSFLPCFFGPYCKLRNIGVVFLFFCFRFCFVFFCMVHEAIIYCIDHALS